MDQLQQFFSTVTEYLHEHWIEFAAAALSMAIGWFWGRRRAKSEWQKKEFLHRLNVSLNVLKDGKLMIRTLIEKSCEDVFLNAVAVETVTAAARKTTASDPILPLPKEDYWYYLNAVLNEVAEKFAAGQIKRDMGLPVTVQQYLLCLTSELAGAARTHKVRAMMMQKKVLENLPQKQPQFESPTHSTRWTTLTQLAAQWKKHPEKFLEVEVCA